MNKLVAVVPIRKGSQRVKHKNFRPFAGKNLLIHKIRMLKKLDFIDEIIINTDSDKAISIAKKMDVKYFKRDKISFYLMIPYFFWSFYALILNSYIFMYN